MQTPGQRAARLLYAFGMPREPVPSSPSEAPPRLAVFTDLPLSEPAVGALARLAGPPAPVAACHELVHRVAADAPDHVLVFATAAALVDAAGGWSAPPPCPLSWFGPAPDADDAAALAARGLAGWWPVAAVDDLPTVIALDRQRWRRERDTTDALADVQARLDDRKWLDRAKGVLAQTRGLGEAEAFVLLRNLAMHSNQRIGDVSRSVTEAAAWAEALNRAGQLRMLSQRLVKLAAQRLLDVDAARARHLETEALQRGQTLLTDLADLPRRAPVGATLADDLGRVQKAWRAFEAALSARPTPASLQIADERATQLLDAAEALVAALETASNRRPLRAVNLCGRQRMLAQRLAKAALLADLPGGAHHGADIGPTLDAFEAALRELEDTPLSTGEIRDALAAARDEWARLLAGARSVGTADGRLALSRASETLLDAFDRLTGLYERSLQVLMS